jgi:hypothetical protein
MRTTLRYIAPLLAAAGAAAAVLAAPAASAQPNPTLPQCVNTGGAGIYGGSSTECASPGNVQINATPPVYAGPWGNMWGESGYYFP